MAFRWIEHTGELALDLEADSERGIFEAGFWAMRELMSSNESPERIEVPVALTGEDRAVLLADWLAELAFHRLGFERTEAGWRARVVLDV